VAGRAAQIAVPMGGPPSRGMEKYKPKARTGWRVRASTGSSPNQLLSYLGIEKADMPQTTHGRMGGLTFPQSGCGGARSNHAVQVALSKVAKKANAKSRSKQRR
jgi:hypothetical protein